MPEELYLDTKAPFNMAIATLMSLRQTLDSIRNIEGRIDYPAEERQRIKIELVKRFFVDSSPLLKESVISKYNDIIKLKPIQFNCIDSKTGKSKIRIKYSFELNEELDKYLQKLQIELQKEKYYMPPKDDMGSIGARMS